jgi:hypothetical protein
MLQVSPQWDCFKFISTPQQSILPFMLLLLLHLQAKRGGLKDTDAVELLSTVFKAVIDKTGVDPRVRI